MQKNLHSSIKLVIVLLVTVFSFQAQAAVITSTVTGGQWGNSTTWVGGIIPGAGDDVIIVNGSAVSIGFPAECLSLTINTGNQSSSVTIAAGTDLTVHGDITINRTTLDGAFKTINVGSGSLSCANLTMQNPGTDLRVNQLLISTGTVNITGDITMGASPLRNKIEFSDAGTLNLGGSIAGGDLVPATNCVVNYNGLAPQTVVMNANYVYHHLYINNASATLGLAVTATRVLGDIRVQSGTFNNGGKGIAGGIDTQIFEVANGAKFIVDGTTSAFPSVFTPVLGATSTVEYNGSGNQTIRDIPAPGYGHLILSNAGIKTVALFADPNPAGLDIQGDLTLNTGITFNARTYTHNIAGNWYNNGAAVTGNNTINFNGTAQSVSGSALNQTFFKIILSNNSAVTLNPGFTAINSTVVINTGSSLIIPAGKQVTTIGNITNSAGVNGLVLKSDASGTGSLIHPNINVPATVERYIDAANWSVWNDGWHFLSSPVATQAINGAWTPTGAGNDYDFYLWDEPTGLWLNYKAPEFSVANPGINFVVGRGYEVAYQVTGTKKFFGNLNVANLTKSGLTVTAPATSGWHLLGNPYASALTWWTGWTSVNVGAVCQIWNESLSSYSSVLAGGTIPAMNGFMVEALYNNASVIIPKTARTHTTIPWYKNAASLDFIKLTAWDSERNTGKESIVRMNQNSTAAFDPEFDGHYLADFAPAFYSLAGNDKLSVNTLPELGNDVSIPFVFAKNSASDFTIELETNQVIPDLTIYLTDNKTGIQTNLTQNPVYSFSAAEGDDVNRFVLHFLSTTGVDPVKESNGISAYVSENVLHINQSKAQSGNVYLFSLTGQLISTNTLAASPSQNISLPQLAPGVYMVKIQTGTSNHTQKIVIR